MNIRNVLLLTLLMLLAGTAVYSQQSISLTLEECLKIGIDSSKVLKSDKTKIDFAGQKLKEVGTQFYPTLKFLGSYSRFSEVDPFIIGGGFTISPSIVDNYTTKFTLNSPLFTGSRISSTYDISEYNLKVTKEDYNKDLAQLKYDIRSAFWNFHKAQQMQAVLSDNIKQVDAHLTDVQNLYNYGLATLNDVLKVKVQLSNVKLMKLDADNNADIAMVGLANAMGINLMTQITISEPGEKEIYKIQPLEVLTETATSNRSEVKSMLLRIRSAESSITLTKASWYPQISLAANVTYANPNPRIFPTQAKFRGTWDVTLQLTYDIWNWKLTTYQTAQAEAQLEQNKIALAQLKDGISFEVKQVYLAIMKAQERINLADETAKQAQENLRVTYDKFKQGLALNSDVVDAEYSLLNANINYLTSYIDYRILYAKLERVTEQN